MPKSRQLEALIAQLNQIRSDPTSELGLATLSQIMASRHSIAIAQAARLVGAFEIRALMPDLVSAFDRLMVKAKDRDPGCRGKAAIADRLYRLEYADETLFLQGIRHVQWEPTWGAQVDTAPQLRGLCALGLVRMNYGNALIELADLLADPEIEARIGAARAISYSENPFGVALLRLRIKVGDTPTVLGECMAALLQLSVPDTLPLAATLLHAGTKESDPREAIERAEVIALVLGESRLPAALPVLQTWWQTLTHRDLRETGLLAIAPLRQDDALQWLLQLLAEGSLRDAKAALEALRLYQQENFLWSKVQAILEQRPELTFDP